MSLRVKIRGKSPSTHAAFVEIIFRQNCILFRACFWSVLEVKVAFIFHLQLFLVGGNNLFFFVICNTIVTSSVLIDCVQCWNLVAAVLQNVSHLTLTFFFSSVCSPARAHDGVQLYYFAEFQSQSTFIIVAFRMHRLILMNLAQMAMLQLREIYTWI